MSGKPSDPANVLRGALAGPFPELTEQALDIIRRAIREADGSYGRAAEALGLGRRTLERLRAEFPELG